MHRAQVGFLVLVVMLVTAPVVTPGVDAASVDRNDSKEAAVEADTVEFRITVYENASAQWTFTYTRILENETQKERFQAFAENFNENGTDAYRQFHEQAEALTANGRNVTGREMEASGFSRSARLGGNCVTTQDCGTVEMSFTWKEFAAHDGDQLVVGDVFGSGLFLSSNQQLVFETGPETDLTSASPDGFTPSGSTIEESNSITYDGEQSFSDQRPRITLEADSQSGDDGTNGSSSDSTLGKTASPNAAGDFPMTLVGGLIVVLLGAGAAIVWWHSEGARAISIGRDDGGAPPQSVEEVTEEPSVPEEELLTDEDRVLNLLQDNGGRMKQVTIVDETGWSKSKVSMLLSDMEDDEQISKLRVGRENIISLSGHEPEAAGSPHERD